VATFRIGKAKLELEIVGAGLRGGRLPATVTDAGTLPAFLARRSGLVTGDQGDLEAFAKVGWKFVPGTRLDWTDVRRLNEGQEIHAGLLARRPSGRLLILEDRVMVRFKPEVDDEQIDRHLRDTAWRRMIFGDKIFEVTLSSYHDLEKAVRDKIAALLGTGDVVFAEPSFVYHLAPPHAYKAVGYGNQWQWNRIQLSGAWQAGGSNAKGKGSRVAIVDEGFHADDVALLHVGVTATFDANGNLNLVQRGAMPTGWHGTFCAGLVGATDPLTNVTGAAPDCELMLVAAPPWGVLTDSVMGTMLKFCADPSTLSNILQAGDGADVISCSLGPNAADWPLSSPLQSAFADVQSTGRLRQGKRLGTVIVWATADVDQRIDPKSINASAALLSISQCNDQGCRVDSEWGSGLAFLAPGYDVQGILWTGAMRGIGTSEGASLAAPCAAGVAALVLAVRGDLTCGQVAKVLNDSCDPQSSNKKWDQKVGWGTLNAQRAVEMALQL
jgi:hypothetical protein